MCYHSGCLFFPNLKVDPLSKCVENFHECIDLLLLYDFYAKEWREDITRLRVNLQAIALSLLRNLSTYSGVPNYGFSSSPRAVNAGLGCSSY